MKEYKVAFVFTEEYHTPIEGKNYQIGSKEIINEHSKPLILYFWKDNYIREWDKGKSKYEDINGSMVESIASDGDNLKISVLDYATLSLEDYDFKVGVQSITPDNLVQENDYGQPYLVTPTKIITTDALIDVKEDPLGVQLRNVLEGHWQAIKTNKLPKVAETVGLSAEEYNACSSCKDSVLGLAAESSCSECAEESFNAESFEASERKCSACGEVGHNDRTCKNKAISFSKGGFWRTEDYDYTLPFNQRREKGMIKKGLPYVDNSHVTLITKLVNGEPLHEKGGVVFPRVKWEEEAFTMTWGEIKELGKKGDLISLGESNYSMGYFENAFKYLPKNTVMTIQTGINYPARITFEYRNTEWVVMFAPRVDNLMAETFNAQEEYFVFADGKTMMGLEDNYNAVYLEWKIPYSQIRDYVNKWTDDLKEDQEWRLGDGPYHIAYDFAHGKSAPDIFTEPFGEEYSSSNPSIHMDWAKEIEDAVKSRIWMLSDNYNDVVDLDDKMTKAEIRSFLTGIPSWRKEIAKRAETFDAESCVSCETPDRYYGSGLCSNSGEMKCISCCSCDDCHNRWSQLEVGEMQGAETFEANAKTGNKVYIITRRCEDYSAYRELDVAGFGSKTEARKKFNLLFKEAKENICPDETIADAKDSMSWDEYWGIMSFNTGEMIYELREVIIGDKGDFYFDAENESFNAETFEEEDHYYDLIWDIPPRHRGEDYDAYYKHIENKSMSFEDIKDYLIKNKNKITPKLDKSPSNESNECSQCSEVIAIYCPQCSESYCKDCYEEYRHWFDIRLKGQSGYGDEKSEIILKDVCWDNFEYGIFNNSPLSKGEIK